MAEIAKGIIDIEINTGSAAKELQALQSRINAFNLALNQGNKANAKFSSTYSKELQNAINKTGLFTAETIRLQTAAATLDKTLSKGKTSLGQFFSAKFNKGSAIAAETMALAAERAKRLQTQFIATSGAANGFQNALAVRPLAAFSSEAAVAAQRSQILSNMLKQGSTQLINFGKNVQWAGRQLMVGFTVPLTIFGSIAGKTFMDLEKQVVGFKKVYGDLFTTPAELNQNLEAVKGLAAEYTKYGIAVKDTIGLAAQAAAAGRQGAELTDSVTQSTRLATLGQMNQNSALETTISLQSAFKLSGQDLADTINFLNMVENQTVVSLQDIAAAIPRVAPVISGLGGDVKDLTVFLAAMQEGGVDASEGANALKSGLASLINPTKQATAMLSGMGINLETIIQANKGDLMGTVQSFAQALGALDQFSRQQALEQVFGKFQYAKLGALFENISREGSQAQQVIATLGYTTEQLASTADKELKTIEESFGVQLTGAVERFKLAIAPIGEIFVKIAIPLVNLATKFAEAFNGLSDGQKQFAAIGAVVVGIVVPAVTMLTGLFLNLVGTLTKIGQGMALFGKGFITGGPVGAVKALTQSSKYLSLAEMDAAMAAQQLSGANQVLNSTLVKQVGTANAAASAIKNLTAAYMDLITKQVAANGLPSFLVAGAAGEAAAVANANTKTGGIRIRSLKRNLGGGVPGSGNTDTVPAMLTPGEFVVNKEATKNNLGLLREINGGKVNGYNAGGKIPGTQYLSEGDLVKTYIEFIQSEIASYDDVMARTDLDPNIRSEIARHFGRQESSNLSSARTLRTVQTSQLDSAMNRVNLDRRPTFAHMQHPVLGVATRAGDFKGGQPAIFGEDAIRFLEDLYESDKESFSDQQKHYFEAGKLNNFRGWSVHGNLGFDISRHLNSGTNNIQDLIADLNIRRRSGLNPYGTMVGALGLTDASEISRVSDEIHEVVTTRLRRMIATGKTTYIDTDLYPHMESAIPRAIRKAVVGTSMDPNMIEKLFQPSVNLAALRARGFTDSDIDSLILEGKLSPEDVIEYESQSSPGKMKKGVALPGFKHLGKLVTTSGTSISAINNSPARRRMFNVLSKAAMTALRARGVRLNSGGNVPGSGNTDTVPAMLTPGEFVVNKKATSENQQLLEMINGGQVQGYEKGGLVQGEDGKWRRANGQFASQAEISAHLSASKTKRGSRVANRIRSVAPTRALSGIGMAASVAGGLSGNMTLMNAGMVAGFAPMLKKPAMVAAKALGGLGAPVLAATAGFALAGFAIYKLNKQIGNAEKSGAEFTNAMYGTAKTIEGIAEQFGTQTNAQAARIAAVERVGGQVVSEQAQQQSAQFVQSEAGQQMIKDIGTVKAGGGNAVEALRNQLSAAIISGAIGTEEARAIAVEVGSAIGDQSIAVGVSGELTKLMGPDGKDLLKNLSSITAKISPKIDATKLASDATSAYEKMNVGAKFVQAFQGGESEFIKNFKVDEISAANASAFAKEAQARELLNLAYQEGTITLKEFQAQSLAISQGSALNLNLSAQALGFQSQEELVAAAGMVTEKKTGAGKGVITTQVGSEEQKQAKAVLDAQKKEVEDFLISLPSQTEETVARLSETIGKLGAGAFGDFLSGKIRLDDIPILVKLDEQGLSEQGLEDVNNKLQALRKIPDLSTIIDVKTTSQAEITQLYDALVKFEEMPDKELAIYAKDNFTGIIQQAGATYDQFLALPDLEKRLVMVKMEALVSVRANLENVQLDAGARRDYAKEVSELMQSITGSFTAGAGAGDGFGSGSGDADKEKDLLKMLMERFKLQEMLIDKQAEASNNRVKQLNREIELEERQVSLRQKGLDQLSKKEQAVNDAYNLRVEALDKVSESNLRITEQEKSRISLASALASGDIAAAATISGEMQQQSAQYQIEDARAALEKQRQEDLESLTVSINGKLMTRKGIEFEIESIQDRIYNKGIEIQGLQDTLIGFENRKLAVAKEREKVETRMFLMAQKQAIIDLTKGKKKLSKEDQAALADYKSSYNTFAKFIGMPQLKNYGGSIAKMAYGGVAYKGSTESPPALKMNYGSTVPGIGMTDKVPALLTPGEFVVRKPVAKKYGGFLNQLNSQVFPAVGKGISSPTYSMPAQNVTNVPVNNTNVVSTSSPMYNSTYNVNVNVSGTNASPDDIANVVMAKLSNQNRGNLRSSRY